MNIGSSETKPEPRKVIEPKIEKIGSLAELSSEGYTLFSLGPVFVFGNVQDDLVAAFAAESVQYGRNVDVYATTMQFERDVLKRCGPWNALLYVMDTKNFEWFKAWLLGLQLFNRMDKTFFVVRHHFAPIVDPLLYDSGKGLKAAELAVFCLSGLQWQMIPRSNLKSHKLAPAVIDFQYCAPEPDVVVIGKAALETIRQS